MLRATRSNDNRIALVPAKQRVVVHPAKGAFGFGEVVLGCDGTEEVEGIEVFGMPVAGAVASGR